MKACRPLRACIVFSETNARSDASVCHTHRPAWMVVAATATPPAAATAAPATHGEPATVAAAARPWRVPTATAHTQRSITERKLKYMLTTLGPLKTLSPITGTSSTRKVTDHVAVSRVLISQPSLIAHRWCHAHAHCSSLELLKARGTWFVSHLLLSGGLVLTPVGPSGAKEGAPRVLSWQTGGESSCALAVARPCRGPLQ